MTADATMVKNIKENFAAKRSDELKQIIQLQDRDRWSEEAFIAARELLQDRLDGIADEPPEPALPQPPKFHLDTTATGIASPLCFGIQPSLLQPILTWHALDVDESPLVGGKLKRDLEYLVIVIPLWFNIVTTYAVFTTHRLLLATKGTSNLTDVEPINYDDLYAIGTERNSAIILRLKSGDLLELSTKNRGLVRAVSDHLVPHIQGS